MKMPHRFGSLTLGLFYVSQAYADDRNEILGTWIGAMQGDPAGSIELTITADKISGWNPRTGRSLGEGVYEIDPAQKTITTRGIASPVKGNLYLGLYSLEGNTLKWVSNSHGKKRPVDVVHRPDRDQFLMILERKR